MIAACHCQGEQDEQDEQDVFFLPGSWFGHKRSLRFGDLVQ